MVRRQSALGLTFETAAIYKYPEHLCPFLSTLSAAPGVYLSHSESDTMPLYISKSVNIHSRVLAHLHAADEAAVLRQAKHVSWICTAGEIDALLLEMRLTKEQQPLFSERLRHNRQLCALQLTDRTVQVVYARNTGFSNAPNLLGLFANRRAALQALQSLTDEQQLCYGLLGLEPPSHRYACFHSALKRCAGTCCRKENHEAHHLCLLTALERVRVIRWPQSNAIALQGTGTEMTQYHIISNWLWLGTISTLDEATTLARMPVGSGHDNYKILCQPALPGQYDIIGLHPKNAPASS